MVRVNEINGMGESDKAGKKRGDKDKSPRRSKRRPEFPKERKEITTIKNKDMDSWNVSSQSRLRSYME